MLCTDGGMCSLQLACASRLFTHSNPSHNDDDFEAETNAKARTALLQHRLLVMNDKSFIVITTQKNFPHSPVCAYNIFFVIVVICCVTCSSTYNIVSSSHLIIAIYAILRWHCINGIYVYKHDDDVKACHLKFGLIAPGMSST